MTNYSTDIKVKEIEKRMSENGFSVDVYYNTYSDEYCMNTSNWKTMKTEDIILEYKEFNKVKIELNIY